MCTTASGEVYPAAVKLSRYFSMPMACSQSSTVPTDEDAASGLPGSNRVVLGLVGGGEDGGGGGGVNNSVIIYRQCLVLQL